MKIRNPWIDPRVAQVRSSDAQAYLRRRGWKELPPEQPNLLPFEAPDEQEDAPLVSVPLLEQARDYPQRVIELITEIALTEGRLAVAVLEEILGHPADANGQGEGATARPAG
jgi:hypothetical protein